MALHKHTTSSAPVPTRAGFDSNTLRASGAGGPPGHCRGPVERCHWRVVEGVVEGGAAAGGLPLGGGGGGVGALGSSAAGVSVAGSEAAAGSASPVASAESAGVTQAAAAVASEQWHSSQLCGPGGVTPTAAGHLQRRVGFGYCSTLHSIRILEAAFCVPFSYQGAGAVRGGLWLCRENICMLMNHQQVLWAQR